MRYKVLNLYNWQIIFEYRYESCGLTWGTTTAARSLRRLKFLYFGRYVADLLLQASVLSVRAVASLTELGFSLLMSSPSVLQAAPSSRCSIPNVYYADVANTIPMTGYSSVSRCWFTFTVCHTVGSRFQVCLVPVYEWSFHFDLSFAFGNEEHRSGERASDVTASRTIFRKFP